MGSSEGPRAIPGRVLGLRGSLVGVGGAPGIPGAPGGKVGGFGDPRGSLEGVGGPAAFWGPQREPGRLGEFLEGVWGLEGPRGALGAARPGRKPSPGHARSGAHPNSPRRKE